jgi:hypothetical protein
MHGFFKNSTVLITSLMIVMRIFLGDKKAASSQVDSSFEVVRHPTPAHFAVKGTSTNSASGADLNRYLNIASRHKNRGMESWNPPPQDSDSDIEYTGTGFDALDNTTVTKGDTLRAHATGGMRSTSIISENTNTTPENKARDYWYSAVTLNTWHDYAERDISRHYYSYNASLASNNPFASYTNVGYTNAGKVDDQRFTSAAENGMLNFNGNKLGSATQTAQNGTLKVNGIKLGNATQIAQNDTLNLRGRTLGSTTPALPPDTSGENSDATDTKEQPSGAGFGKPLNGFAPAANMTPEGSGLTLIAAGLLPLAWYGRWLLKRRTA